MKPHSKKNKFDPMEKLSAFFSIYHEMIECNGEDNFFYSFNGLMGIMAVFDGCGGLGAIQYPECNFKTGAYIASRIVAISLKNWFHNICDKAVSLKNINIDLIKKSIDDMLHTWEENKKPAIKVKGSMARSFPTTMASVILSAESDKLIAKTICAGDSRVYLMDKNGLAQLSNDDVDVEDAYYNLTSDGTLKNLISASHDYKLNSREYTFDYPCVIFTATDGCFGYILTPMHFEYLLLVALREANNLEKWKENIENYLVENSGDDFTLCLSVWGFDSFDELKNYYASRTNSLMNEYGRFRQPTAGGILEKIQGKLL